MGFTQRNPERVAALFLKVPPSTGPLTGQALRVPAYMVLGELDVNVDKARRAGSRCDRWPCNGRRSSGCDTRSRRPTGNGDILRAEGSGTSTLTAPGQVALTSTLTIVGGTGRFANATGELQVEGEANSFTGTASFEIVGWMSYSASDRSGP